MTRPPVSYCRTLLLYALLASAFLYPGTEAVVKGGGGSSSGARSSTGASSAAASSSRTTYGRSVGVSNRIRVVAATTLAIIYFNGLTYPGARFYYNGYYDDCALRNITAQKAGLNDSSVDEVTIAQLPNLIAASNATADIYAFNQTLYNSTNGLIIDSAYCNYTSVSEGDGTTSGAPAAARLSALLTVFLVASAMWVAAASRGGVEPSCGGQL